ncbi:hypothetical protein [Paenibacillus guangzhouensis]|uniref:hypothetical protein n=1 Tax=Paenibacillus guangzhouensis TaxID=1473112 RepID=UPI001266FC8D|nr:hypothetical protein [Paenibacillus guangzhouensis]
MRKIILGCICGVVLFSGAAYAASSLTTKSEQPQSINQQKTQVQKLPITQTIDDIEVTVHAVRLMPEKTDFEITIKNNKTDESIMPVLVHSKAVANVQVKGKVSETVDIAQDNPDFRDRTIKPSKEKYGWLSYTGLSGQEVQNLTLNFSVKGKDNQRNFSFAIDCKDLQFRKL